MFRLKRRIGKWNCFLIKDNNEIIGYAFGHIEIENKDKSYVKKNQKSFSIEEIYIIEKFRNKGYGKQMVKYIENFAKKHDCENLHIVAVSKNYKKLLKFYIEELDFLFWSAFLTKKI